MLGYPRRNPVTAGYLVLLGVSWLVVRHLLGPAARATVLAGISTDLANLPRHPLAPLTSLLVVDTSAGPLFVAVIVAGGIGCCLAALERRYGAVRALAVGVGAHLVATVLSLAVVLLAVRHGWYPASVARDPDYGPSYLAIAAATAVTPMIRPRWLAAGYLVVVLALPFADATWYGALPDFTTIGHLVAAGAGLVAIPVLRRGRWGRWGRRSRPGPG